MVNIEDLLAKNRDLKNIHNGRRCFVVGNGPSLKTQNLHALRDEIAIVTSSFHLHEAATIVRPGYWVMADPAIWSNPEKHFLPNLRRVQEQGIPSRLFLPTGGLAYFESVNSGHLIDLHFFHYDHGVGIEQPIDFTHGIPPFGQNVVIASLMLAFYMGCNPIYFIGCDHDFYRLTRDEYEKGGEIHHAHPGQNVPPPVNVMPWDDWQAAMARMDWEYEQLKAYAGLWGFDVFNATRGGCLENFPRVEYESLFSSLVLPGSNAKEVSAHLDPLDLGKAAVGLLNSGDTQAALALLNESVRANVNRHETVAGLDYLKAVCLARMGQYGNALLFARQDYHCNPSNRGRCVPLIHELEMIGA